MSFEDQGKAVREGEELPIQPVEAWLKNELPDIRGQCEVTQFHGGASNWTYRLKYENYDLILRRAPAGTKAKSAHNMKREFELQQAIKPYFTKVPDLVGYCEDDSLIGSDFYVMHRVSGIIPRKNLPRGLELSAEQVRSLCKTMIDTLVELHQISIEDSGLTKLGKGEGFVKRQVEGWNSRYQKSRTWNVPKAKKLMEWLQENQPSEETLCMTHNDFRFDNLVLNVDDPTEVLAVLDWELATIGDPLMEVGNLLAYWVEENDDFIAQSTRRQPTHLKGMMTREEVIEYYFEKSGVTPVDMTFYQVFGLFRLSVIAQQIYYRYHHKQTRNPAFKNFWFLIHYLHHRAWKLIKKSRKSS
ncbi:MULTISPECIES: phosphotransferase family protein [Gammaproteobacteria]|uniref:phosphotransferase family protein n=1 Tax=Gammaproteobacteria TaxID=1236 RepID=UPI000DD0DC40|nr:MULTISPECIES: phosphotransferase family protein [Gammaproteobacteria]RTE87355.1 phosphotransferase family protein [Aliidiomarina sp. B3213]TCZ92859.1 phosphotransferase family protein [Lysobacter sp. N42]